MNSIALREDHFPGPVWRAVRSSVSARSQYYAALSESAMDPESDSEPGISVFGAAREPEWLPQIRARVINLLELPEGWDGHGGKSVNRETMEFALQFLAQELDTSTPAPWLVPLSYGGIQAEWHEKELDLEIEFIAPNKIHAFCEDHRNGQVLIDDELETDFTALERPINELTNR